MDMSGKSDLFEESEPEWRASARTILLVILLDIVAVAALAGTIWHQLPANGPAIARIELPSPTPSPGFDLP